MELKLRQALGDLVGFAGVDSEDRDADSDRFYFAQRALRALRDVAYSAAPPETREFAQLQIDALEPVVKDLKERLA